MIQTKPSLVIKDYFGPREEQFRGGRSALVDFAGEMKALSPEEKNYLAAGAAKEMGYTPEQIAAIEKAT